MRRILMASGGGLLAALMLAAAAAAADPTPSPAPVQAQLRARDIAPAVLGLSSSELQALRQDGLSLAQIAARQHVDPQELVAAFTERWTQRIEERVANGGLTVEQATALRAEVQARATTMIEAQAAAGMRGAAVGAGPASAGAGPRAGSGRPASAGGTRGPGVGPWGDGSGTCDGTGPHGAGRA